MYNTTKYIGGDLMNELIDNYFEQVGCGKDSEHNDHTDHSQHGDSNSEY